MNDLTKIALWAGIEDYSSLWEFLWEINTRYPDILKEKRLDEARRTIDHLYCEGWIKLYRSEEPNGDLSLLTEEEIPIELENKKNWQPSDYHGVTIRFDTTETGKEKYHSLFAEE